jgi:hypothetical protein
MTPAALFLVRTVQTESEMFALHGHPPALVQLFLASCFLVTITISLILCASIGITCSELLLSVHFFSTGIVA